MDLLALTPPPNGPMLTPALAPICLVVDSLSRRGETGLGLARDRLRDLADAPVAGRVLGQVLALTDRLGLPRAGPPAPVHDGDPGALPGSEGHGVQQVSEGDPLDEPRLVEGQERAEAERGEAEVGRATGATSMGEKSGPGDVHQGQGTVRAEQLVEDERGVLDPFGGVFTRPRQQVPRRLGVDAVILVGEVGLPKECVAARNGG